MPIKKNKISYTLDLEQEFNKADIAPSKRKSLSELIGITLLDEIVSYLDKGTTPVSKGEYKRSLSKEYREKKRSEGKRSYADMQLTESMLNNLSIIPTKKGVEIKLTDSLEKKKAYNHNVGDTLPKRQWLPNDEAGESFKRSIISKVKEVIQDASED
jgi:hypothetical protein